MALAAAISRRIQPTLVLTEATRSPSGSYHLKSRVADYTPKALKAITDATKISIEYRQKYVQPKSLMISLMNQEGFAVRILEEVDVNTWLVKLCIIDFIRKQPQTTCSKFVDGWLRIAQVLYAIGLTNVPNFMFGIPRYNPILGKVLSPRCHLNPILYEARNHMLKMGGTVVGEEHLLMAYTDEPRLGKSMFTDLRVTDKLISYAVRKMKT